MYIVGDFNDYSPDDFRSNDIQEAYTEARRQSEVNYETVIGIWTDEGDKLLAMAHAGTLYLQEAG